MFHSAALKLTVWYLSIIMAISLVFSFSLYKVSSDDLGRNVNRQVGYFNDLLAPDESLNYSRLRSRQLGQDLSHLKSNLVLFNLIVLVGGGAASYMLARRTLEPIEETLESQSRFASDASHELRTPLTAMITENEVALRDKNLNRDGAIGVIKSNLEEAIKLKALAEGLLRLSDGKHNIENAQPVELKTAVAEAMAKYEASAKAKKIKILNNVKGQRVTANKDSLVELLSIFLDNAVKYTPAGGKVEISAKLQHKNIAIQVADSGQGIRATDLPHIFDRFYRADSSRHKDSHGGYGLGLSIAKNIVEAHHGHIEVSSTPSKGTKFNIFLPAA